MKTYQATIEVVPESEFMADQWQKYQRSFDYPKDISFEENCNVVIEVMNKLKL